MAHGVGGPAGERAVVEFGDGCVAQHADAAVAGFGETFGGHVESFAGVVELPTVAHGGRVGLDLADDVHALASGGAHHHHLLVLASRSV